MARGPRVPSATGPGHRWLVLARFGGGVLLAGLAAALGGEFAWPGLVYAAAAAATLVGAVTWWGREHRLLVGLLFLADVAWISLAVVAAGTLDTGLTLLFPLVAFGAGLFAGGRLALGLSMTAAAALLGSVALVPGPGPETGRFLTQALLVLVLGVASDRMRSLLAARERALDVASRALEQVRLDTDSIVRNLTSGVLSVDRTGNLVHVNRVAEETLGIKAADVRGRPAARVLPHRLRGLVSVLQQGLATGEAVQRGELELTHEGRALPLGVTTTILFGPDGEPTGAVALFQDLTEIRQQEVAARRRDRLAAVGELAAGIAHEIRNSVLPISGSVQILSGELDLDGEQRRLFDVIERETDAVERFVSELLAYTKSQAVHPAAVELRALALETAEDTRLSRRDDLTIRVEGEETWARVDGDRMKQAVRNLVHNAADAVGEGGTVVLRTGCDSEPWIEVDDDGPGIRPEDRERVLQPFFTSKPGGTGLGLAIVSRIVEEHEGRLGFLDSGLGGARVRLTLPATVESPTAMRAAA